MIEDTIMADATTDYAAGFRVRLRELTKDAGGIKEFSERADISYPAAKKYLVSSDPTRAVLMKIITALNVNPSWLLVGNAPKYSSQTGDTDVNHDAFFRLILKEALADERKCSRLSTENQELTRNYLKKRTTLSLSKAVELADLLNLRIFKASGEESNQLVNLPIFSPAEHESYCYRSYEFTGEASAKDRYTQSIQGNGHIAFDKDYLIREFDGEFKQLVLFQVKSRDMEPSILNRSDVIVDCSQRNLNSGELFLFRLEGNCAIRRAVQRISGEGEKTWLPSKDDGTADTELSDNYIHSSGCVVGRVRKVYSDPQ